MGMRKRVTIYTQKKNTKNATKCIKICQTEIQILSQSGLCSLIFYTQLKSDADFFKEINPLNADSFHSQRCISGHFKGLIFQRRLKFSAPLKFLAPLKKSPQLNHLTKSAPLNQRQLKKSVKLNKMSAP